MKIGIEAQRVFRRKKHGMDIVALQLIRNLQLIDKENQYYIFVKDDEDNTCIAETPNFKIVKLPRSPYPVWEQILLPIALKKYGIELLHCTSNTAPLAVSVPLVITLHDIIYLEKWNFTRGTSYQIAGNLYRRINVPPAVNKAAKIVTVSDYEKTQIENYFKYDDGKVVTIYNGVGERFNRVTDREVLSSIRKKYKLPEKYVFFLGNTEPKKNVEGVMRALSYLRRQNRLNFTLLMLDIDRKYLNLVADYIEDKAVLDHISFTGYVPNQELPAIYSMASLFLYPSLRESFGIPILEAMACGVPVITSNTSAMPEVAGDAAVLINPENPEELGENILRVLEDDNLRQRLVEKGLVQFKKFSWKNNARQTLDLYRNVLQPSYITSKTANKATMLG